MTIADVVSLRGMWGSVCAAALVFGFMPGAVLRLIVLFLPPGEARRVELIAELYVIPYWQRPTWVAQQIEVCVFEGLRLRTDLHRQRPVRARASTRRRDSITLKEARDSHLRILIAELEARRQIQADLHDGTGSILGAVQLRLDLALKNASKLTATTESAVVHMELMRASKDLTTAINSLRDVVAQIYPAMLRDYGLRAALEDLSDRSTIPLILNVPTLRWSPAVEATAYRVISEAVRTHTRHSQPTRMTVRVEDQERDLMVQIVDDGHGQALPLTQGGLARRLHDQVVAAGGTVAVIRAPGTGTRTTIRLPKEVPHAWKALA